MSTWARKIVVVSVMMIFVLSGMAQAAYVPIGGSENAADGSGYGAVDYEYNISTHEVTIAEMVAATGAGNGDENEWSTVGTDAPAANVTLYEAMKYCNFLTSGDATDGYYSDSGSGVYTVASILSHDAYAVANGTTYFVPTEDEWYKAAYYDASGVDGYSLYANGTDTAPVAGTDANSNYALGKVWIVGTGTEEQNGTYDMMGNVFEWMEDSTGIVRGGAYYNGYQSSSQSIAGMDPDIVNMGVGFRPVEVVPEPATIGMVGLVGALALLIRRRFLS